MKNLLAQGQTVLNTPLSGIGSIGSGANPAGTLASILSTVVGLLTLIAGIYFMFNVITGAIEIISSGGNKGGYESARSKITFGVIGIIVVIGAMFIVDFVTDILGVPDLLDIGQQFLRIRLP